MTYDNEAIVWHAYDIAEGSVLAQARTLRNA